MQIHTLEDVLEHEIRDLYSAEKQILQALPKMASKASSEKLKKAFEKHLKDTEEHVDRIEEAAADLGISLEGAHCKGMEGLIKEGEKLLEMDSTDGLDAALISAAQRVEHYEIAGYGCAITYAKKLGHDSIVDLFKPTIDNEEQTDKDLTKLAEGEINEEAVN